MAGTDPGAGCCQGYLSERKDTLSVKQVGKDKVPLGRHRSGCHEGEACAQSYAMMMKSFVQDTSDIFGGVWREQGISVDVEVFSDGEILCSKLETGKQYDLLFLDIIMKHEMESGWESLSAIEWKTFIPGFFICPAVRSICWNCLTASRLDFGKAIDKGESELRHGPDSAADGGKQLFWSGRISRQVPYREILYYESRGRKVLVHTNDGIYEYFGKLSQIMDQGLPSNFLCIHKSYIVNLDHVGRIHRDCMYLPEKNRWLSISKIHRRQVKIAAEEHRTV